MLGKVAGAKVSMRQLGGVFGIAALVAVFAAVGSYDSPAKFGAGFAAAMGLSAAFSLAGAIAALGLPGRPEDPGAAHIEPGPGTAPDLICLSGRSVDRTTNDVNETA